MGDFHKAMTLAPRGTDLSPDQTSAESKLKWLKMTTDKLNERLEKVLQLKEQYSIYSGVFYLLPTFVDKILEKINSAIDLGLKLEIMGIYI